MGKNKLQKFADMEQFENVFQLSPNAVRNGSEFELKGKWYTYFNNSNPIVLELGCGKGEYTVELAKRFPNKNFIGIDIKGARMWTGAKQALEGNLSNVAFLRTSIELLDSFFNENEVDEVWITFPDPQMKKVNKRLTSTRMMNLYQKFIKEGGIIHLKTDSNFMFTYTRLMVEKNGYQTECQTDNLYNSPLLNDILSIKTHYEKQWIERGINIKYIAFFMQKKDTFVEVDDDIEYDSYRSYNRSKRSLKESSNDIID
ncbi:MAG: tRNA (guanosine(46)-N7)-methyltransferase TrmB [Paludibacteraceae bacterium]|nr:tRNA (guanosine(46)-N7)-methyltransferase TrmB [Paludibacteraceae bacterium]